ncbi:MAG: S8 family serine peptidase [Trueperaceae bacterium]|nr:S8 family serine peptidase [Trueperaceae bacterium]
MRNLHILTLPRATSGWLWAGILVLLLAACGTLEAQPPSSERSTEPVASSTEHAYIATVDVTDTDTPAAIAAAYGGEVVVWRPEAGFAILGLPAPDEAIDTLDRPTDRPGTRTNLPMPANAVRNEDAFSVPQFDDAVALSVSAWAGSVSAWAGGVNAWAGGVNAWAGGVNNPFPGNEDYWQQMQLGQAQDATTNLGQGVTIAIIDTGLDLDHVAFTERLAPSGDWLDLVGGDAYPHEGYEEACIWRAGPNCKQWSTVKTGDGPFFGHGTGVAGVALQAAPNATLLPIRVLNSWGHGSATDVAKAIDHAIERGADVINLSLGTFEPVAAIDQMVAYAGELGIAVVMASGNTGDKNVWYPAATAAGPDYPHAISVGSVDAADVKSWFSTYGLLETLAPGEGISTLYPGDALAYAIGTSFATPWVTGTVALILGDGGFLADASPTVVAESDGIDHLNPSWAGLLGSGRLNTLKAVNQALN